jgi:hypothetical protein
MQATGRELALRSHGWALVGPSGLEERLGPRQSHVDGLCPFDFDPTRPERAPSEGVVLWTSRGGGPAGLGLSGVPALRRAAPVRGGLGELVLETDRGALRVPPDVGRVVAVEDLLSPKALVLYGDDRRPVVADLPMAAHWRPFVRRCDHRWEGDAVVYEVELFGLQGVLTRRYAASEVVQGGEPPDVAAPDSHLRVMVWPRDPPPRWRLFVVDVGTNSNRFGWNGKFSWGLFHHPTGRDSELRVVACRDLAGGAELRGLKEGRFDPTLPPRVATAERPSFIEIRRVGEDAVVGTFNLLGPPTAAAPAARAEAWAIDLGSQWSCVARATEAGAELIDLNQASGPQVFCRVGDAADPRSELQWMPGVDTPLNPDALNRGAITQLPSRLALLVRDRLPDTLSAVELRALTPMCDAIVPPANSEYFGLPMVDDCTVEDVRSVDADRARRVAMLEQYLVNLLVMSAARIGDCQTVTVTFSHPFGASDGQRAGLEEAARAAVKRAASYTGVSFGAQFGADGLTCLLEAQARQRPAAASGLPVWVVCDVGTERLELVVASGDSEHDHAVLACDALRFGPAMLEELIIRLAGAQVTAATHPETRRHRTRELLARAGYAGVLARCNPSTKDNIRRTSELWVGLVVEYLARAIVGPLRNPRRLRGLMQAEMREGGYGFYLEAPEDLPLRISVLLTGRGAEQLLGFGEIFGPRGRLIESLSIRLRDRCDALLRAEAGPPHLSGADDAWFAQVPAPELELSFELSGPGGSLGPSGARAQAILAASPRRSDAVEPLEPCATNGLTEYTGWRHGGAERWRPWFAVVGEAPEVHRSAGRGVYRPPREAPWHLDDLLAAGADLHIGPPWPAEVLGLARDLRWNLDLDHAFKGREADLRAHMAGPRPGRRYTPLLKALYEVVLRDLFTSEEDA